MTDALLIIVAILIGLPVLIVSALVLIVLTLGAWQYMVPFWVIVVVCSIIVVNRRKRS